MNDNVQVCLARTPQGVPEPGDFTLAEQPRPEPKEGEALCQTLWLSLDPYMRSQIAGRHLSGAVQPSETMRGETVSRVVESRHPDFAPGDLVRCFGGWRSWSTHAGAELHPLPDGLDHPSYVLSTLGMPGLTAYAGLVWQADPQAGETVVVPAAIGAVGSVAGQLAKQRGCRVVGVAGSEEKCRIATEELGYDACINRNAAEGQDNQDHMAAALDAHCPDGIDVYFDLVGGPLLDTVSARLAQRARVILCGLMAEYNSGVRRAGPPPGAWIIARAVVHGLVVYDFETRRDEFVDACLPMVRQGRLKVREDIAEGLAAAPEAFCRLMRGENIGKALVRVA